MRGEKDGVHGLGKYIDIFCSGIFGRLVYIRSVVGDSDSDHRINLDWGTQFWKIDRRDKQKDL